jgi:hypothetical protein
VAETLNQNGCYLVASDGTKLHVTRSLVDACKKFISERLTGSVTIGFRNGGIASVEDRTVYPNTQQQT